MPVLNCMYGKVHYLRFGEGPELLIALHGFGDKPDLFQSMEAILTPRYTVVAPTLPWHGNSEWHKTEFDKTDFLGIVHQLLQTEGKTRCSIMGYSFGARLILAALPELRPVLQKIILLAPDGIATRGMNLALLTPMFLRHWIQTLVRNPERLLRLLKTGQRLGLVPAWLLYFASINMALPQRQQRVFGYWLGLNTFATQRKRLRRQLTQYAIPVDVYTGAQDPIIRKRALEKMVRQLPHARLMKLKTGHRIIGQELLNNWQP